MLNPNPKSKSHSYLFYFTLGKLTFHHLILAIRKPKFFKNDTVL